MGMPRFNDLTYISFVEIVTRGLHSRCSASLYFAVFDPNENRDRIGKPDSFVIWNPWNVFANFKTEQPRIHWPFAVYLVLVVYLKACDDLYSKKWYWNSQYV